MATAVSSWLLLLITGLDCALLLDVLPRPRPQSSHNPACPHPCHAPALFLCIARR